MITPEQLESYGYGNEEIFAGLEQRIMDDIVRRIKDAGVITRSADFQINELRRLGFSNADIKSMLQDALDASDAYIDELYQTAIETDYISNKQLYDALDKRFIPFKQNAWLQNMITAAKNQTKAEMHNLSNSLGFVIRTKDGTMNMTLTEYYQKVIDQAIVDIQTGGFDYNRTLRKAVKQMSNSGIRWINYDTGWHNRITVAARRSVMTAISQMSVNISDDTAKKLGIDTFEISAHANPRPTHAVWQGTVKTKLQLIEECGLGSVTGLLGANCYHVYYPFIKGASKRAYTDEQLRKWADPTPKTYKGKEYTGYEAKQRMRQMETNMRAMREEIRMLQEGGGDPEDILNAQVRYRTAMYEYGDFAKKMGMKQQKERIYMDGLGNVHIFEKRDILIPRSVGATGRNYPVLLPDGNHTKFAPGTEITKIKVFAGKGTKVVLRNAAILEQEYSIPAGEWQKVRGDAYVLLNRKAMHCEVHWYEAQGERVKFKVKRWFEDES